ncbi:hypothetical protein [Streptomyces winkii]|uniref:hypothetical protein n=1 Tax=Streptomyces winkii TaxID=3051178 RepID=UPI0028D3C5D8|nr:hypothetical protein [Streptomyces sp. DSM 40971]
MTVTVTESAAAGGFAEQGPGAGRFVRVVLTGAAGERVVDEHLRAGLHAPPRGRRLADVLVGCGGNDGPRPDCGCAACTGRGSAVRHPGALVVAVPRNAECVLRYGAAAGGASGFAAPDASGTDGRLTLGSAHRARAPWEAWASLAHAWLVAGWPMEEFGTLPEAGHRRP